VCRRAHPFHGIHGLKAWRAPEEAQGAGWGLGLPHPAWRACGVASWLRPAARDLFDMGVTCAACSSADQSPCKLRGCTAARSVRRRTALAACSSKLRG